MNVNKIYTEVKAEILKNILPFWMKAIDLEQGGFAGRITGAGQTIYDAPKGGVLNARILWTFAAAYRVFGDPVLMACAERAKCYLIKYFLDKKNGGIFWILDHKGNPVERKKQIYALAFAIYGLSEYHRITGDKEALEVAVQLFNDIEIHSFDKEKNGYFEAFASDWSPLGDVRLSEKDANETKTMNTHLHILEAYANLYLVWKSPLLKMQIENLIDLFLTKFLDPATSHLRLFFNNDWENRKQIISYGHDIEASWLMYEAALKIENQELIRKIEHVILTMADSCIEGIQPDGSMAYELNVDTGHLDSDRHWWVQAETIVGYFNAYQLSGDETFLKIALNCWDYTKNKLIDKESGEWFWSAYANGGINRTDDKLGIWKCPYHNGRMCLELLERIERLSPQ